MRLQATGYRLRATGLSAVSRHLPVGLAIDDLMLIAECSHTGEWEGQVRYLPL